MCNVSCISSAGLYELFSVLPSQLQPHVESADDRSFLHTMFGERSLHSLVKVSVCAMLDIIYSIRCDVTH